MDFRKQLESKLLDQEVQGGGAQAQSRVLRHMPSSGSLGGDTSDRPPRSHRSLARSTTPTPRNPVTGMPSRVTNYSPISSPISTHKEHLDVASKGTSTNQSLAMPSFFPSSSSAPTASTTATTRSSGMSSTATRNNSSNGNDAAASGQNTYPPQQQQQQQPKEQEHVRSYSADGNISYLKPSSSKQLFMGGYASTNASISTNGHSYYMSSAHNTSSSGSSTPVNGTGGSNFPNKNSDRARSFNSQSTVSSSNPYGYGPQPGCGEHPPGGGDWHEWLPCESPPASLRSLQSFHNMNKALQHGGMPSITYGNQAKLARLPIPSLEETLFKFPSTLEALQDDRQRDETKRVVEEFLNGPGPKLQELLVEYEKQGVETDTIGSYVEEFWNESYLSPDATVVLNLNPYFVLEDAPDPKMANDQLRRGASLCFASVKFASVLKRETLAPDMFKGQPLCMDQFRALFGSSRHPTSHDNNGSGGTSCDEVHVYSDSCHVAVLCKNQFYYFRALWPDTWEVAVDEDDIHDILRAIKKHAHQVTDEEASHQAVAVLSSLPRSRWAKTRETMCQSEQNAAALNIVDSALFVLVLDDFAPQNAHETAANMLHGTNRLAEDDTLQVGSCLNRWYDKLQLIVCEDGTAGCNFEHSAIDGHTALRFTSDVFAETVISFADSIVDLIHGRGRIQHVVEATIKRAAKAIEKEEVEWDVFPRKIMFDVDEEILSSIYYAETYLCDEVAASETMVLEFKEYGKTSIVNNKMSPDSVVQMAILLAYYKLYGNVVSMYEPVLTKSFYHGRTEAMRPATIQAKQLCETWCNKYATPEEKLNKLRIATIEHSRLVREASRGYGVDRHLFALKCIAQRNGMRTPLFFESEAWKMLNHTVLSTSNCGNPSLRLFGFGPVVPNGFGIGYIIKDYGLSFSVSTKHRQTQRYVRSLKNTLREIKSIMAPTGHVEVNLRHHSIMASKHTETPTACYDDFGENSVVLPPTAPRLQAVDEHHESPPPSPTMQGRRKAQARRSSTFTHIKERTLSLDWLRDEEVRASVREVEVLDGSEEDNAADPASEGVHWYY